MNFDLHEINYGLAIGLWAAVFFGVFSFAALIAFLLAPIAAGVGGRGKLIAHLTGGRLGILCWPGAALGLLGAGITTFMLSGTPGFVGIVQSIAYPGVTNAEAIPAGLRILDRVIATALAGGLGAFGGFMLLPAVAEACTINFSRVWTIAMLTWREAVRRRALYVFVVFALLFMFAGWFLSGAEQRADMQVKPYVSFVLTAIPWLTLPVVMLLACWGIPDDIRVRSMHTVVTKPIRRNEIFLGRVVGYSLVGTAVIVVMGTIGYLWISRQVPANATQGSAIVEGREVKFGPNKANGKFRVEIAQASGEPRVVESESPSLMRQEYPKEFATYEAAREKYVRTLLTARVPVHGRLSFYDRNGNPARGGLNVGDIWEHRSYIEGGTNARAVYRFENIDESLLVPHTEVVVGEDGKESTKTEDRLRIETNFEAFRSHKGKIEQGLVVELHFVRRLRRAFGEGLAGIGVNEPGIPDFVPLSRAARAGNFDEASEMLGRLANGFETEVIEFTSRVTALLPEGYEGVARVMDGYHEPWADEVAAAARAVADGIESESHQSAAAALRTMGEVVGKHSSVMEEKVTDIDARDKSFIIKEFRGNVLNVPRSLRLAKSNERVDLFDDVVHDGKLWIEVACLDRGQYLGMARPDLFIRTPDNWFLVGYAKAVLAIWMLLVLVVLVGVTAGTFVKGPVATLLVVTFVFVGVFFHAFLLKVVSGAEKGSGLIESGYRLNAHLNPVVDLDNSATVAVIKGADSTIKGGLWVVSNVIPDLNVFFLNRWIASGFDIRWDSGLAPAVFTLLAYLLPCLLLGFYSLKLRELEAK